MAAIRRSFSGALQRRRSASMTPEQKTEETKLERLTERFERGMRNLKTLEARLITVGVAAHGVRCHAGAQERFYFVFFLKQASLREFTSI